MSAIEVRGVTHRAGGLVLDIPEFAVPAGGHVVLFGPNGAGKTTLLRLLAGTLPGRWEVPSAYLPQRPYLYRGRTVHNLTLGLDAAGRDRARLLAERFGVGDLLLRPAKALSGGERQRVALARVLARPEDVVLLDEPLTALDAADRPLLGRLVAEAIGGRTAVIVTHDRDEAVMLADTMAVMVAGRIRQMGPARDVLGLPGDDAVAAVLGVANAHAGSVCASDGALLEVDLGGPKVWGVGETTGEVVVLFGAETVTVYRGVDGTAGSARNRWTGTVSAVRPLGRLVEIVVDAGFPVVALLTPGSIDALGIHQGGQVTVAVKATAVRVVPR